MKKILVFMTLILLCVVYAIAQEATPTDTVNTDVILGGDNIWDVFTKNWAILTIMAVSFFDSVLSKSGKIRPGSILDLLIGFIYKFLKKQLPTAKAAFMTEDEIKIAKAKRYASKSPGSGKAVKTILLLIAFTLVSASASAQGGIFSQFGKVTKGQSANLLKGEGDVLRDFYIKPAASFSAMTLTRNPDTKKWEASAFSAAGIGLGGQHYTERNGVLVNDYGVNALFAINMDDPENVGFGALATVNIMGFVDIGGGRDFSNNIWMIHLGANWTF